MESRKSDRGFEKDPSIMVEEKSGGFVKNIFNIIKEHKIRFIISSLISLVVYSFLYGFWKIPIIKFGINRMSEIGLIDYLFVIVISILISLFIVLFLYEKRMINSSSSFSAVGGGFAGLIAGICPVCQGIVVVALGSTLLNIPTPFLIPYLGFLKFASLLLLGLAVYFKADSIYKGKCKACEVKLDIDEKYKEPFLFRNNIAYSGLIILTLLVTISNLLIPQAFATTALYDVSGGTINLGSLEYGSKITLKPMPLGQGEQPVIAGYNSKVKSLPTISELQMKPQIGDAIQDLLNNIIPTGTPLYGDQAGVSFDDPIKAQNLWAKGRAIQLSSGEEQRWSRIVNSFTCDYCCGSPQNPTIITRCGCAHSAAAQGMAKWFIKNYGNTYSDEEIYGEMARWYALWYPGPTIKRILQEAQV